MNNCQSFFQWLKNTFLKYINDWQHETKSDSNLPKELQAKRCLSYQTLEGIRMTGKFIIQAKQLNPQICAAVLTVD